jgi:glutathione S-transferase
MVDFMIWPWFERIAVISTVAPEVDITHDRFPHLTKWMTRMLVHISNKKTSKVSSWQKFVALSRFCSTLHIAL